MVCENKPQNIVSRNYNKKSRLSGSLNSFNIWI